MWIILTIITVVARAVYGVLTKVLSGHVKVHPMTTQTVLLMAMVTLQTIVIAPFVGGIQLTVEPGLWWPLGWAILTSTLGNVFYFYGVAKLSSGSTQIIFSSIVIWGALLSWMILGSRFGVLQLAGILLLLCAILMVQYQRGFGLTSGAGIWLVLISAACFAGFQVSSAVLSKSMPTGTYLFLAYLSDTLLLGIPYAGRIIRDLRAVRASWGSLAKVIFLTGLASVLYNLFAYLAYHAAPDAGIVVVLLTTQVILAVLLSILFLHERNHMRRKLLAASLAVVAAVMIKA